MREFVAINTPEELDAIPPASDLLRMDSAFLSHHAPDQHWVLVGDESRAVGRLSLWWTNVPSMRGERLGVIGHYGATDGAIATELLNHACSQLVSQGCTKVIGPMDGNTWRRYRLVTDRGSEPQFFLELDNPDDWPNHFTDNGFTPLASYKSTLTSDLARNESVSRELTEKLLRQGISIRVLDASRFEEELRRIYGIAEPSFQDNFLYTPISEPEFIAQYRPVEPYVRPELVLIAERDTSPVGFVFALPDLLQAKRGGQIDTVIVKTLGVLSEHRGSGLGTLLTAECHRRARSLGFARVIHALMYDGNVSQRILRDNSQTIRRYTLFSKALRP